MCIRGFTRVSSYIIRKDMEINHFMQISQIVEPDSSVLSHKRYGYIIEHVEEMIASKEILVQFVGGKDVRNQETDN